MLRFLAIAVIAAALDQDHSSTLRVHEQCQNVQLLSFPWHEPDPKDEGQTDEELFPRIGPDEQIGLLQEDPEEEEDESPWAPTVMTKSAPDAAPKPVPYWTQELWGDHKDDAPAPGESRGGWMEHPHPKAQALEASKKVFRRMYQTQHPWKQHTRQGHPNEPRAWHPQGRNDMVRSVHDPNRPRKNEVPLEHGQFVHERPHMMKHVMMQGQKAWQQALAASNINARNDAKHELLQPKPTRKDNKLIKAQVKEMEQMKQAKEKERAEAARKIVHHPTHPSTFHDGEKRDSWDRIVPYKKPHQKILISKVEAAKRQCKEDKVMVDPVIGGPLISDYYPDNGFMTWGAEMYHDEGVGTGGVCGVKAMALYPNIEGKKSLDLVVRHIRGLKRFRVTLITDPGRGQNELAKKIKKLDDSHAYHYDIESGKGVSFTKHLGWEKFRIPIKHFRCDGEKASCPKLTDQLKFLSGIRLSTHPDAAREGSFKIRLLSVSAVCTT